MQPKNRPPLYWILVGIALVVSLAVGINVIFQLGICNIGQGSGNRVVCFSDSQDVVIVTATPLPPTQGVMIITATPLPPTQGVMIITATALPPTQSVIIVTATPLPPTEGVIIVTATLIQATSIVISSTQTIALGQCEFKRMMDETAQEQDSIDALISELNAYYGNIGLPNRVARDATLTAPTILWMDLGSNAEIPNNLVKLRTQGNWGVFLVQSGNYSVTTGAGGRYIGMAIENECPLAAQVSQNISSETMSVTATQSLIKSQLDTLFGDKNWFCFPRSQNDIGINTQSPLAVQAPLSKVEYWSKTYFIGETLPGSGGATATLNSPVNVLDCPTWQQSALEEWQNAAITSASLDINYFDNLLGSEKWDCVASQGRVTSIFITSSISNFTVEYPFNSLDSQDVKYGVGQTLTNLNAGTLWLALGVSVSIDVCS